MSKYPLFTIRTQCMLCWLYPHSGSYGLSDDSPQLVKQPHTAGNQVIANCLYSLYSLYVYILFVTCSLTYQCISDDNLDIFGWDNLFCTINGHLYDLDWRFFSSGQSCRGWRSRRLSPVHGMHILEALRWERPGRNPSMDSFKGKFRENLQEPRGFAMFYHQR